MNKSLPVFGLMLGAALLCASAFAVTPADAPETITLDGCMDKKAAVEFPHAAHFELTECTTCHHTQEGLTADADMEVEVCDSCHKNPVDAETPDCAQMSLSKNPYHIGCVGCHKEGAAGPTKCDECHPKAE